MVSRHGTGRGPPASGSTRAACLFWVVGAATVSGPGGVLVGAPTVVSTPTVQSRPSPASASMRRASAMFSQVPSWPSGVYAVDVFSCRSVREGHARCAGAFSEEDAADERCGGPSISRSGRIGWQQRSENLHSASVSSNLLIMACPGVTSYNRHNTQRKSELFQTSIHETRPSPVPSLIKESYHYPRQFR